MVHITTERDLNPNPLALAFAAVNDKAMQNPLELGMLTGYLLSVQPEAVVEIGCATGATFRLWESLPSVQRVLGVTLDSKEYGSFDHPNVMKVDSRSSEAVSAIIDFDPDFVHVDGGHDYATAIEDIETALAAVRVGGIVAIHDIWTHTRLPGFGVKRAWEEMKREHQMWMAWEIVVNPFESPGFGIMRKGD